MALAEAVPALQRRHRARSWCSMPTNSTPSPAISICAEGPRLWLYFSWQEGQQQTHAGRYGHAEQSSLRPISDDKADVTVVPTLAPMMTPTAWASDTAAPR